MKRFIIFIPVLLFALGCSRAQPGLEQTIYPPANNNSDTSPIPEPAANETSAVKVAVIALNDEGKNGKKIGCDDSVVYVSRTIPKTTQPLNEAMKQLFSINNEIVQDSRSGAEYYNVISKMEDLKFSYATIENSTAKIYLVGNVGGLGGVCDSPRVPAQIEETAKQFSTVTSVETYLDNKKVNWQELFSQK